MSPNSETTIDEKDLTKAEKTVLVSFWGSLVVTFVAPTLRVSEMELRESKPADNWNQQKECTKAD